MLKIAKQSSEPFWLDASKEPAGLAIPGFRVKVRPVTVPMILAAREEGRETFRREFGSENPNASVEGGYAYGRALCRLGIEDWEGVVGPDDAPLPVTPESIDAALSNWRIYDFLDRRYVGPALVSEAEKNASAPSHNGTGGARTPEKATAKRVRSRARTVPTT